MESELLLNKTALDALPCSVILVEVSTKKILLANKSAEKINAVPGEKCCKLISGKDDCCPWCFADEVCNTGQVKYLKIEHFSGKFLAVYWIPLDADRCLHYVFDISERKQAWQELEKQKELAQEYLNVAGVLMLGVNLKKEVILINKKGCEVLGYKKEEIMGKNWIDNFLPERIRKEEAIVSDKLFKGEVEPVKYYENPVLTKSGQERIIAWHNTVLKDEKGKIIAHLSSGEDITARRNAEDKIIESEERLRQLAENSKDWIWEVDANGLYTYSSGAVEAILGYEPAEIVGKKYFYDFFVAEEKETLKKAAFKAFEKKDKIKDFLNKNVHKNGTIVWLQTCGIPQIDKNANLQGYRGSDRDITWLIMADEYLRVSEEKYRLLFEKSSDAVVIFDMQSLKLEDCNQAALELYGYTREEFLSLRVTDISNEKEKTLQAVQKLRNNEIIGKGIAVRWQIRKDGSAFFAEINQGRYDYRGEQKNVSAIRDVTQKYMRQEEERRQKEFIEKTINSLPFPYYVIDTNYNIILANKVAKDRGVYEGGHCYELTHRSKEPCSGKHNCPLKEVLNHKQPVRLEHIHYDQDGQEIIVEVYGGPIFNAEGEITHMIEYSIDISERKRYEQQLKDAYDKLKSTQEQLMQAAKMRIVGSLASGVAHEVKNPLGTIMQGLSYIDKKIDKSDRNMLFALNSMNDAVNKADSIIRGLLDFARVTELNLSQVNLENIIDDSLLLVKYRLVQCRIEVEKDIQKGLPKLNIDRNKIEQVFVNIFLNAAQEMSAKGEGNITVRIFEKILVEHDPGVGQRRSDVFKPGEAVVITEIEDTGPGIRPEQIDKVFEPFFTTHHESGGTGLGMAIVKSIVDMHKGLIMIGNKQDFSGAKVTIILKTQIVQA
ncbi:MAG: PAS domain S-box protein [Candidatus Omnitrophica bacterium]|nr:PAS domain S-box protein [Candidatus Omnitrophota bacterium]